MNRSSINHLLLFLVLLIVVGVSRWVLFLRFPIILTADSWNYIAISEDIYSRADFFGPNLLGDWRLLVYPLFLVFLRSMVPLTAVNIVLAQKTLGVACVIIAGLIGHTLGSRLAAVALVLFIALNPSYLLYEHLVMTETLFLLMLLAFTWVTCAALRYGLDKQKGFLIGITMALCLLTRANGLFFCIPFLVVVIIWAIHTHKREFTVRSYVQNTLLPFTAAVLVGLMLFFLPWLWRNYQAYGRVVPFTNNTNLNMLAYLAEHELLDVTRPSMQPYAELYDPENPRTVYALLWKLRTAQGIAHGEQAAAALVREHLRGYLLPYGQQALLSFLHFSGYPIAGNLSGRADVQSWFASLITNVEASHALNKNFYTEQDQDYINSRTDNPVLAVWSNMGIFYLRFFRPFLFSLFILLFIPYFLLTKRGSREHFPAISAFTIAYLVTILAHSLTLSDYDRFATPFDWIPVLVICLITIELLHHRGWWRVAGTSDQQLATSHQPPFEQQPV